MHAAAHSTDSPKPTLFRIIKPDYLAILALLLTCAPWAMYLTLALLGYLPNPEGLNPFSGMDAPLLLNLSSLATIVCVPYLVWRVRRVRQMFSHGEEVRGRVKTAFFHESLAQITYVYTYRGWQYVAEHSLRWTAEASALGEGDEVTVLVDPSKPQRSIIRDLYV